MNKRLPPYGKRFLAEKPCSGPWIAQGPGAWDFAKLKPFSVMVLPEGDDPVNYRYPVASQDVMLVEVATYDTERLERTAQVLLESGARMVYAIRTEKFSDGRVFWRSKQDVAA